MDADDGRLPTAPYLEQAARWPASGRHVLASFDASSIVVYQAYRPSIAEHALAHQRFGGPDFSFSRMSWIKPGFLWMMHRSSWATAEGQERVLAIRLPRAFFDQLLSSAVASSYDPEGGASREQWQDRVAASEVRVQWDPDHDPTGERLPRRAIQLGLRGQTLRAFATDAILDIVDMTPFVAEQRPNAPRDRWPVLRSPVEDVYELP